MYLWISESNISPPALCWNIINVWKFVLFNISVPILTSEGRDTGYNSYMVCISVFLMSLNPQWLTLSADGSNFSTCSKYGRYLQVHYNALLTPSQFFNPSTPVSLFCSSIHLDLNLCSALQSIYTCISNQFLNSSRPVSPVESVLFVLTVCIFAN
jgi:hypothetical protein